MVDQILKFNNRLMAAGDTVHDFENKMRSLEVRHGRARSNNHLHNCYSQRISINTLDGLQSFYIKYAEEKVEETLELTEIFTKNFVENHIETLLRRKRKSCKLEGSDLETEKG